MRCAAIGLGAMLGTLPAEHGVIGPPPGPGCQEPPIPAICPEHEPIYNAANAIIVK